MCYTGAPRSSTRLETIRSFSKWTGGRLARLPCRHEDCRASLAHLTHAIRKEEYTRTARGPDQPCRHAACLCELPMQCFPGVDVDYGGAGEIRAAIDCFAGVSARRWTPFVERSALPSGHLDNYAGPRPTEFAARRPAHFSGAGGGARSRSGLCFYSADFVLEIGRWPDWCGRGDGRPEPMGRREPAPAGISGPQRFPALQ